MRLADRMSNVAPMPSPDDELVEELRRHFEDAAVVELGMTIAVLTGMARLLFAFDLADQEPGCPISFVDGKRNS